MSWRLGRLAHDPVKLAAAPRHTFGAAPPPPIVDRSSIDFVPGLYQNDTLPVCTCAGLANVASGLAALNGYGLVIDPAQPVAFYAAVLGVANTLAAIEATDGTQMADVLNRMQTAGFNAGPRVLAGQWGTVTTVRSQLATSIARLGVGYWGVTLKERDMEAFSSGAPWDVQDGQDDGATVGGHAVIAWDYTGLTDHDTVRIGTWGTWQTATWAWVADRLDEAHGVTFPPLARTDGTWFDGYDPAVIT